MKTGHGTGWVLLTLLVLAGAVGAQEPTLLSEGADGILKLEGERRLEIDGLQGSLSVRLGKAGEMRFAARRASDRSVQHPVALWLDGATLRLTALHEAENGPVRLEVAISPELDLLVEADDSVVQLAGLHGTARIRGERLDLSARTLAGSLEVELHGGSVQATGVAGDVTLDVGDAKATLERLLGRVTIRGDGGETELSDLYEAVDADVDNGALTIDGLAGRATLRVGGGPVVLSGCQVGGELQLVEAPLRLTETQGRIEVETDAEVRFANHEGPLTVRGRGGDVWGEGLTVGPLTIETGDAEVRLEALEAPVHVRGDGLELHASGCKGEMTVKTMYSNVVIERPEERVSIENGYGDVSILGSAHPVQVVSREGLVRILEQSGPLEVRAEGPEVAVEWTEFKSNETSTVENSKGDVRVSLPTSRRCNVDLQAPHGEIETDVDEVKLTADGHYGSAVLMGGGRPAPYVKRPTIRVIAGGDLYFTGAARE